MFRTKSDQNVLFFRWLTALVVVAAAGVALAAEPVSSLKIPIRSQAQLPETASGQAFRRQLDGRLAGVVWNGAELRSILREMTALTGLSIIRDRSLDPTQPVELSIHQQTYEVALAQLAGEIDAKSAVVGNVIYIGPPNVAGAIRTLVEMRSRELSGVGNPDQQLARRRLSAHKTVSWGDLAQPREIGQRIATAFGLRIINPAAIGHDLWEGGTLPEMTAAEMLTVVLIQFDLTFEWEDEVQSILLVPLPEDPRKIAVEHSYRISAAKRAAFEDWQRNSEFASVRRTGGKAIVRARVDQHEALKRLLHGSTTSKPDPMPAVAPLKRQRFTLSVQGVPAQAIINRLKAAGITFEYDAAVVTAAGIDFMTPVSMDLKDAPPEKFLGAIFDPLGLDFEFSGTKVVLRPK